MAKKLDAKGYRKFSMMDKLAYGAGDFACNMSFALKGYLMVFWTQYMGIYMCVSNSMMADAIDYNEWKFGVRDEGTIYAIHSFFRKLAQGVFPSIGLLVAAALGSVAVLGPDQSLEVATKMRYLVAVMYLIAAVCQFIGIQLTMGKKKLAQMFTELNAKNA